MGEGVRNYSLGSILSNKEAFSPYLRNAVNRTTVYPQQNHCLCSDSSFHSSSHLLVSLPWKQQRGNDGSELGDLGVRCGRLPSIPHGATRCNEIAWECFAKYPTYVLVVKITVMVIVTSIPVIANMYWVLKTSALLVASHLITPQSCKRRFCFL